MSYKDEQKVMKDLDDLMYPSKKIKKKEVITRKQYYQWEQQQLLKNKKGGIMTKEKKVKPKTADKKVDKKKVELKDYQKKEWLVKNYPSKSAGAIAREQGVSRASILNQLRKHGIKIVTRTSPKTGPAHLKKSVDRSFHDKKFLIEKMNKGLGVSKIASLCGTSFGQVKHFILKHDLMAAVEGLREKQAIEAKANLVKKPKSEKKKTEKKSADLASVQKTIKKIQKK